MAQSDLKREIAILVIEDDKNLKRLIKSLLKRFGFERIEEASDGTSALQILSKKSIQLVIADWHMPAGCLMT